ncbi:MAG: pyridoxamine 5'-phosphate oxidase family protein [Aestuariivirga sp.]
MQYIQNQSELEAIYSALPAQASTAKVADHITPAYRKLIEHSPFVALATTGPEGLDCSPRGEAGAVVRVLDEGHIAMPDRRGTNRIDSMRNIVADPRVALLFLLPGSGTTFRINGIAKLTADEDLCKSFEMEGKLPRSVIVVQIEAIYFQCARAVIRAGLWDSTRHIAPDQIPSAGQILDSMTSGEINGSKYDAEWPGRAKTSMW